MRIQNSIARLAIFAVILALSSCRRNVLTVAQMVAPDYPLRARIDHIQGAVELGVQMGMDGKVMWAHGAGANPVLVEAAEENARKWIWGPFPARFQFPYYHEIYYVYKLEGKPTNAVGPSDVKTDLPDRIEIISPPLYSPHL